MNGQTCEACDQLEVPQSVNGGQCYNPMGPLEAWRLDGEH